MSVISNTTVLSNFAAVERLDWLQALYGRVYMPTAVYAEIRHGLEEGYTFLHPLLQQVFPVFDAGWIHLTHITGEEELRALGKLPRHIHAGEEECLVIAQQRGWLLLTDDRAARQIARQRRIALSGTLGSLLLMVERNICPLAEANHLLAQMIHQGYRSIATDLSTLLS